MVTKSKDLRTGRSVWEQRRAPPVPHQPLKRDIETDVLVIGAGITGAMVADALRDSGLRIAVVDRRGPAKGSSTASTALVQYEIDMPLIKLARKIGQPSATSVAPLAACGRRHQGAAQRAQGPGRRGTGLALTLPAICSTATGSCGSTRRGKQQGWPALSSSAASCARGSALRDPPRCWVTAISPSIRARRRLRRGIVRRPGHAQAAVQGRPPRRGHQPEQPGVLLPGQGKLAEAEPLYKDALEMRKRLYKGDHPDLAAA